MAEMSQLVMDTNDATFENAVKSDDLVVVDCWAPWCGPCRILAPTIEGLAKDYSGRVRFYKLNTDDNPKVAAQFRIRSIPTIFMFHKGKLEDTIIGAVPRQYIEGKIQDMLK